MRKPRSLFLAVILIAGVMLGLQLLQAEAVAEDTDVQVILTCEGQNPYGLTLTAEAFNLMGQGMGECALTDEITNGIYVGTADVSQGAVYWIIYLPMGWMDSKSGLSSKQFWGVDLGELNDEGLWQVSGPLR